ncbi:hypothetical protein UG55_102233 [Frankia sp. EI5c]|nr:hypothetical protein UG55_102233 [Frankia sp. EI5c]
MTLTGARAGGSNEGAADPDARLLSAARREEYEAPPPPQGASPVASGSSGEDVQSSSEPS